MPAELPSDQQFVDDVEAAMSFDQEASIQGQELAEAENELTLNAAKIHFMDVFEWVKLVWIFNFVRCIANSYL